MSDNELAFIPAHQLKSMIASRQVSPVEVTKRYLERIDRLDSQLNSYLTVAYDEAMTSAKVAEDAVMHGSELGPLHGIPISIKDLENTKGIRTTNGSLIFKDRIPKEDSIVVERVKNAGAIVLGKTNTPEFGFIGTTENRLGDACRNPWNPERTSGGSSGGAGASLATGLCSLATGSDGGGSIRIPASFCGVYGIKPSQGRVPRYVGASSPRIANQFSQSGPLTRTVKDSALLLQVLAGHDSRDPTSIRQASGDYIAVLEMNIKGWRIGLAPNYGFMPVESEVAEKVSDAAKVFEELGCIVEQTDFAMEPPVESSRVLFFSNGYAALGRLLEHSPDLLTDYVRKGLELGKSYTGADYARTLGEIDVLRAQFDDMFDEYDLLLSPTAPVSAFPVGQHPSEIAGQEVDASIAYLSFTYPINLIGYTAASIPCGFSSDGMPIGLHIVGRFGDEEKVLAASAAFERARPWSQHRPHVS